MRRSRLLAAILLIALLGACSDHDRTASDQRNEQRTASGNPSSSVPATGAGAGTRDGIVVGQPINVFCETPLGALPPAVPTWCNPGTSGDPTFKSGKNSWLDDFNHGLSNAGIGPGYQQFGMPADDEGYYKAQQFRHNNHWMVDIAPHQPSGIKPPYGGGFVFLRPDRAFTFQDGTLVVEADVAAGVADYIDDVWVEVIVATAEAPTYSIDDLYAYGQFGGQWAFGCRLDPERYPICDLKNDRDNTPQNDHASQTYQISPTVKPPGASVTGGHPQPAWRACAGTAPDENCRDRFRLELTKTTFALFVNGTRYFSATNLPPLPEAMTAGPVYVYFANTVSSLITADVIRFHWDRLAINP